LKKLIAGIKPMTHDEATFLNVLSIDSWPLMNSFRSTAMGVTLAAGRLGAILANIVFGYLINVNCAVPIISVAGLLVSGGLLGIWLPNTTKTALI